MDDPYKAAHDLGRLVKLVEGSITIPDPPAEIADEVSALETWRKAASREAAALDYRTAVMYAEFAQEAFDRIQAAGVEWLASDGLPALVHGPGLLPIEQWSQQALEAAEFGRWRVRGTTRARWNRKLRRFQAEAGASEVAPGEPGWQSDLTRREFSDLEELAWSAPKGVARRLAEMAGDLNADKQAHDNEKAE